MDRRGGQRQHLGAIGVAQLAQRLLDRREQPGKIAPLGGAVVERRRRHTRQANVGHGARERRHETGMAGSVAEERERTLLAGSRDDARHDGFESEARDRCQASRHQRGRGETHAETHPAGALDADRRGRGGEDVSHDVVGLLVRRGEDADPGVAVGQHMPTNGREARAAEPCTAVRTAPGGTPRRTGAAVTTGVTGTGVTGVGRTSAWASSSQGRRGVDIAPRMPRVALPGLSRYTNVERGRGLTIVPFRGARAAAAD